MQRPMLWFLAVAILLVVQTAGCTLKGTTQEITDTTSNITASTSGRIWWNEDGLLKHEHKSIAFLTYTEANLEQDVARAHGEYLASLGALIGVEESAWPAFQNGAQSRFQSLIPADHAARLEYLRELLK
ncbi:MAG TPA: DUF3015 family protein [Nitrospira sp.]|nr:DUF3015 family protein [Nitrospira sp.]